jgi:hypothetical protein
MKKFALLLALPAALAAQTVLEGVVVDAVTGNPLAGASVGVSGMPNPNSTVVRSDAAGHFQVTASNPFVMVMKAGYLQASKFATSRNAQDSSQMRIALKPEAVITGKVVDEDGFAANHAQVQAMRYGPALDGARTLTWNGGVQTDDQGEYRIDKLPAGKYYIHVNAGDSANWDRRYAAQYLGGTLDPSDEHVVEVKMGEVHKNADVHLVKIEGVTVSGRVEGGPGDSRTMPPVSLSRTSGEMNMGIGFGAAMLRTPGESTFTFRHVPPGSYTLHYGNNGPQLRAGDYTGELKFEASTTDLTGLVLTPHAAQPIDVTGQIVMREGGPVGTWMVYARRNGEGTPAEINPDGTFVLKGLLPGHYNFQATPDMRSRQSQPRTTPPPHVVSTTLGDQELKQNGFDLDGTVPKPLRITVSSQYAVLTGMIVDAKGQAVTNTPVIFVSDQPNKRGYANTDDKGAFRAMLTDAGDYRAYILPDQESMNDEDYLAAHKNDFPVIRAFMGDNGPIALQWKTGTAQ